MLECMDNYTLSDYVNHSMTYYAKQLDTYNQDDNYALTILSLMNEQYEDYHDDNRENPQSVYYPIYDYISKMYLDEYYKKIYRRCRNDKISRVLCSADFLSQFDRNTLRYMSN